MLHPTPNEYGRDKPYDSLLNESNDRQCQEQGEVINFHAKFQIFQSIETCISNYHQEHCCKIVEHAILNFNIQE